MKRLCNLQSIEHDETTEMKVANHRLDDLEKGAGKE
jgi:hypothetical protein